MNTSTSSATTDTLRIAFSTHGLPEMVVTDNGSNFVSEEFEDFLKRNGIRHIKTAPYHPSSNGLAERAVRTFKEGMKKLKVMLLTKDYLHANAHAYGIKQASNSRQHTTHAYNTKPISHAWLKKIELLQP